MSSIKIRAKHTGGTTRVRVLLRHPMETGLRVRRKTGEAVAAHHITEVTVRYRNKQLLTADWGPGVATNPYLEFRFRGGVPGETLTLKWTDNRGGSDSRDAVIA